MAGQDLDTMAAAGVKLDETRRLGGDEQLPHMGTRDAEAFSDIGVGHGGVRIARCRHGGPEQLRLHHGAGGVIEEQHRVRERQQERSAERQKGNADPAIQGMKLRVVMHHGSIVVLGVEHGQRSDVGREPVAVVRPECFRGLQDAHAPVLIGRLELHEARRAQPCDQTVDVAVARQAEQAHLLLQAHDREPGFAPSRVDAGVEDARDVIDEEPSRLDQKPNGEGITSIDPEKSLEKGRPRVGQTRMADDGLVGDARRPADKALDLRLFQRRPRSTPAFPSTY